MKRQKKHPRRKAIEGLTPADVIAQMTEEAHGKKVRAVRRLYSTRQVLPQAREGGADRGGAKRLPATSPGDDPGRPSAAGEEPVPDSKAENGTQLSRVLKRMLGDSPPAALMDLDGIGRIATNAEALAAIIWREALAGRQWAVEMVRDQTEGKPVRAAQINSGESEIEEMLDAVGKTRLNKLAKGN